MGHFFKNQTVPFLAHKPFSIVFIFKSLFPSVPWGLNANFTRVRKTESALSFGAIFKATALVETEEILSEY